MRALTDMVSLLPAGPVRKMAKRTVDVVLSSIVLVILAPVFAAAAIAIKMDSRGPVFFRGVRIGAGGRPFRPYKFRTMVVNAQAISSVVSTPNDDPRTTRVGRVLRKYNLDELPQLINVWKGEMSIVGPRPEVPQYVAMFSDEEREILSVRPGIADWATLWIKDKGKLLEGCADPEELYMKQIRPMKIKLQLEYVRRHSVWIDFGIMMRTLKTHFFDRFRA